MPTRFAVAVALTLGAVVAQSVGVTLTAVAPLPLQVSDGVVSASNTFPAGPMPANGYFQAMLPGPVAAGAALEWQSVADDHFVLARVSQLIFNSTGPATFSGTNGPHSIRFELSSAVSRTATLELGRTTQASGGAPWPTVAIDYDDDGVIDIADLSVWGATRTVTFGPQPLKVRIVLDMSVSGVAGSGTDVALWLTPDNDLTITQPVAGCTPMMPPPPPFLQPSFDDRGIDLSWGYVAPAVLVFGFSVQPALLAMNGVLPCVLLPSPDVVLYSAGMTHLPLPAAVRPVTFFVQGVVVTSAGLRTSDGYIVQAN